MAGHVAAGTHLACMGTDTKGKQEVEVALVAKARLFTDEVAQSVTIGEAQHAVAEGLVAAGDITPLGAVLTGAHGGRGSEAEITIFDGTGVGLQDLAVAASKARVSLFLIDDIGHVEFTAVNVANAWKMWQAIVALLEERR